MGKIPPPTGNYTAGDLAFGGYIKDDLTTIVQKLNGNIDGSNITDATMSSADIKDGTIDSNALSDLSIRDAEMEWPSATSGVKAWQCGPNFDSSSVDGHRIVRQTRTVLWSGSSPDQVTFFFSSLPDSYPWFSAPPNLLGEPIVHASNANDAITSCWVTSIGVSLMVIEFAYGGGTGAVTIEFSLAGPVSR